MSYFKNEGNDFNYEFEDVIKLFFLPAELSKIEEPFLFCYREVSNEHEQIIIQLKKNSFDEIIKIPCTGIFNCEDKQTGKEFKRILKRKLFVLLSKFTGKSIPWGIMTGIRPAKLVNEFLDEGVDRETIIATLKKDYFVTEDKAYLLYDVASNQRDMFLQSKANNIALYIGIPFCPTRCLYCSFSSSTLAQYKNSVDTYLDALLKEIKQTGALINSKGLIIESIYIGGGTPTSLNNSQLNRLLKGIEQSLDLNSLKEYTLEAGRPDTIDKEKLVIIKDSKVSRISINPQTMNAETLIKIGRKHTPEDIEKAFYMARDMGFDNINMDLICGLPGEDTEMFENTLFKIADMAPDSMTVHTMAIKRASRLTEEMDNYCLEAQYQQVAQMVDMASQYAKEMGLLPYYLYRQKNILGNLENVGYSKKDKESLYNIQIMEERQTILACGAGAVTKVVFPENRIERAFNVKSVEEYIGRIDEMIDRKYKVIDNIFCEF